MHENTACPCQQTSISFNTSDTWLFFYWINTESDEGTKPGAATLIKQIILCKLSFGWSYWLEVRVLKITPSSTDGFLVQFTSTATYISAIILNKNKIKRNRWHRKFWNWFELKSREKYLKLEWKIMKLFWLATVWNFNTTSLNIDFS